MNMYINEIYKSQSKKGVLAGIKNGIEDYGSLVNANYMRSRLFEKMFTKRGIRNVTKAMLAKVAPAEKYDYVITQVVS